MNIKGTKSEKNVAAAFAGESQARNKYTYYMQVAKAEGLTALADFYEQMAKNEMNHAKVWFKLLNDGLGSVEEGLIDAAKGESDEWTSMYPQFAKDAREEGLEELAQLFEKVAGVERDHERRFLEELMKYKSGSASAAPVLATRQPAKVCMYCGYIHLKADGEPPYVCPLCGALGAYEDTQV